MLPGFSLVVPAFDEASRIEQTLGEAENYLAADSPDSEIIVVDDGSRDGTADIVRAVSARTARRLTSCARL